MRYAGLLLFHWEYNFFTNSMSFDSTLGPDCVADAQQAVIYYLTSAVNLFKKLPTYNWLAKGGITPSSTETFTRDALVNVLRAASAYGFEVGLECNSDTLFQVNYYYNVSVDPTHTNFSVHSAKLS